MWSFPLKYLQVRMSNSVTARPTVRHLRQRTWVIARINALDCGGGNFMIRS
jgi:hypothetical protein